MLYVLEIPHQREPICWTANDKQDFINKIERANPRRDCAIFDARTVQELMNDFDSTSPEEARENGFNWLAELIQQAAPDFNQMAYAAYNRPNHILLALDEYGTYREYLASDLNRLFVFVGIEDARQALDSHIWQVTHNGLAARKALQNRLNDQ